MPHADDGLRPQVHEAPAPRALHRTAQIARRVDRFLGVSCRGSQHIAAIDDFHKDSATAA